MVLHLASLISTDGLTKRFGSVLAVDNLSFGVEGGSVTGLIGPNGAGKTTTIKMVLGILHPDNGSVRVFDRDPWDNSYVREHTGVVYERANFPPHQQLLAYLRTVTRIFGVPESRAYETLEQVGLSDDKKRQIRTMSAGMLQKFAIAHALLHDPEIVIADEPTANLDPQARNEVLDIISRLNKEGVTFFISSHILPELSRVCNSIIVMNKGKAYASGRLLDLIDRYGANSFKITCDQPSELLKRLPELPYIITAKVEGQELIVMVKEGMNPKLYADVSALASEMRVRIYGIESRSASLEELFRQAVGGA